MELVKDTTFEFGSLVWQVQPPRTSLVVVVKGTLDIVPGGVCKIADEQVPCTGDEPWAEFAKGIEPSVQYESDLAVVKPHGECFVTGSCFPAGGRATNSAVSFRLGSIQKTIAVYGERYWSGFGGMSRPEWFTEMALRWERSFGGPTFQENPLGRGIVETDGTDGKRRWLPNIEDPRNLIQNTADLPSPVNFAPIPRSWQARTSKAGTYDEVWKKTRFPWFPSDFDWSYFCAAPTDQHLRSYFRGDEELSCTNLHREKNSIQAQLPGLVARCFALTKDRSGHHFNELVLHLDTITLAPNELKAYLVWRGLLSVSSDKYEEVERLFVLHEPFGQKHDAQYYQAKMDAIIAAEKQDDAPAMPDPPSDTPALNPEVAAIAAGLAAAGITASIADNARGAVPPPAVPAMPAVDHRAQVQSKLSRGESLAGADLTGADLSQMDLRNLDLTGCILKTAKLNASVLDGSKLEGAVLIGADLTGTSMRNVSLQNADLTSVSARGATFDGSNLEGSQFSESQCPGASFKKVSAIRAEFIKTDLSFADGTEAVFNECDFTEAKLNNAVMVKASFKEAEFARTSAERAKFDESVLEKLRAGDGAVFSGSSFRSTKSPQSRWGGSILNECNFAFSNLEKADFSACSLVKAWFDGCNIKQGRFQEAKLVGASIIKSDVFEGTFEAADLSHADLRGSNFFAAEFLRAVTTDARLELANLTRTKLEPQ